MELWKTTLVMERDKWKKFKQLVIQNNSDASKEMRKLIEKYIKENESK